MHKILLAGVAVIAGVAGFGGMQSAFAQSATSSQAPGTITVRLNGRVNWYAGVEGSSLDSNSATGEKTSTAGFLGYMRLYPGFDGVAANGLHYGAAAEIRENSGASAGDDTLYVFQAYGYLGLPQLGQVSFGQQNGPSVLFETGTFEGFNDGGWNGDIEGMIPGAAVPVYPFPDSGSNYDQATNKIVYLSPTIGGFQFAIGFTPNQNPSNYAPSITSSPVPIVGGLPRNMIDIGGQYTHTFGAFGVQAGLDYTNAGQVAQTSTDAAVGGYKDMSIVSGGLTLSYAGFTVGGNSSYGAFNMTDGDTFGLEPDGGAPAVGWLGGAEYTAGPFVVGASYFHFNETGDLPGGIDAGSGGIITAAGLSTGQQQDTGVAAGMTYTLVPGVSLFADYLYGVRQQGGYDFASGNAGSANNYVQSQLFGVGTQIQW